MKHDGYHAPTFVSRFSGEPVTHASAPHAWPLAELGSYVAG